MRRSHGGHRHARAFPAHLAAVALVLAGGVATVAVRGGNSDVRDRHSSARPAATAKPATASAARASAAPATTISSPCGGRAAPRRWAHVVWIWMENKPYSDVLGSAAAPAFNRWASRCGVAANYRAITHPSLPNYLAATGGTTAGVTSDCSPGPGCSVTGGGVFGQVSASGGEWASYEESMPGNCATTPSGRYAVKHNPAAYYTGLRRSCSTQDMPLGTPRQGPLADALRTSTLPTFSFVTPDLCDDTHDCAIAVGDAWLDRWLTAIVNSASYRAGGVAVFVTWDEDDRSANNHVPLLVVAPSVRPATVADEPATHYSLLRTTEDMLGLPPLGKAAAASSLRSAFDL